MRAWLTALGLICAVATVYAAWTLSPGTADAQVESAAAKETHQAPQAVLPGARPEIRAEQYPSLQAAIDALPEQGGIVRIPPGEFEITQPLVISRDDVRLEGAGGATHIVNRNEEGQPAIHIRHTDAVENKRARLWRIQIGNLRVTGNEKSGHGIHADRVNEIFLQGVTVSNHGGHGIFLDNCYEDPRINDCLITYNKQQGVHLVGCHDIVVNGNHFEENVDALHCIDGYNLCMNGNNLDDHLGNGVVIENTYGSVLSGNMIEECQGLAVILDRDCYGITISANVIAHNFAGGVDLRDAHGCAVSANTFTIVREAAVKVGPGSGRITISANNFSDSFIGESKERRTVNDQAAAGILLESTRDIAISGNLFSGLETPAIAVQGENQRVAFTGNVLTEVESQHGKLPQSVIADNVEP